MAVTTGMRMTIMIWLVVWTSLFDLWLTVKSQGYVHILYWFFLLLFCLHLVATDWLLWLRWWWKPWFYWLNQCLYAATDRDETIWGKVNVLGYMYRCNIKQKLWNMQHRFWLVLTYDLLEDRRILDNVTMSNTLPPHFIK